jgi:hypothetical protein
MVARLDVSDRERDPATSQSHDQNDGWRIDRIRAPSIRITASSLIKSVE